MYELLEFYALYQDKIWVALLGLIVFALTYILKIPIKHFTNKIKPKSEEEADIYRAEKLKKFANTSILLLPFALGVLVQYVYTSIVKEPFNAITGIDIGIASIVLYAAVERFIYKKPKLKYDSGLGQKIKDKAKDIVAKGKISKETKEKIKTTAIDELNNLLKK